jgi:RNA polymerase sigma-70 factor (ECF subfamily)
MATEEELVLRIKNGDMHAFESLYELYKRPVANLLYRLSYDREKVDDLMQEIFLRVWKGVQAFRGASKVSTYIFRIAYNVWINESRRPKRKRPAEAAKLDEPDPGEALLAKERVELVKEAIKELPENDRIILVMSEYNGMSYEEIGEILGIPLGTVKSRMFYALRHLREKLKGKVS